MKRFLLSIFIGITFIFASVSCFSMPYNATVLQDLSFNALWLAENRTFGAYYTNPDYNPNDEQSDRVSTDTTSPKARTFIVDSPTQLNQIFSVAPTINFDNEILLIHCYTTIYNRKQVLDEISLNGTTLYVEFDVVDNNGKGDASMPGTRVLVLKMDKIHFEETTFVYNGQ